jgi:hypothetical protein
MKASEIITRKSETDLLNMILGKFNRYPEGSLTPRNTVNKLDFTVKDREEAEHIVKLLDTHITNAINDFQSSVLGKK